MALAITDEHRALAEVARAFLAEHDVRAAARRLLEEDGAVLPPFWKRLCELGWPGLHLPEEYGGQGFGIPELAVVVEEMGRVVAPGPFLPTVLASGVLAATGSEEVLRRYLPTLADGSRLAAVALEGSLTWSSDGRVSGQAGPVAGATPTCVLVLPVGDDLVVVDSASPGVRTTPLESLDLTRRTVAVHLEDVVVDAVRVLPGARATAVALARVLAAAEAAGIAHACTEMAVEYAKVRVQFGRTIGSFQAVKHHCADMLVAAELATAAAWDAARAFGSAESAQACAVAVPTALDAAVRNAQVNIQVHGGIGFTWEHDAHLYLRRAVASAALFGPVPAAEDEIVRLTRAGAVRRHAIDLPPEAEAFRADARAFAERYAGLPADERRTALVDSGYLVPHWPRPWGRAAGAVEQLVIEEELAGIEQPSLGIGGWVTLTLAQHGTPEQIERWIRPSLLGELRWCQLFSEPGAGSDAAAVQTRAVRVEGGWRITGQKVWTSGAQVCNRGLATVRTDSHAPKHKGITALVVDMEAEGVTVRPLREITGESLFNEVFFDEVFVPDADVVGEVNQGWTVARATLGNERVSIGGGSQRGLAAAALLSLLDRHGAGGGGEERAVARLIAEEQAMRLLNLRQAARAVAGGPPGPEGNITKLLSAEHAQHVTKLAVRIAGPAAVSGGEPEVTFEYLFDRCLTIAGGTSEIGRNVIAERLLGLPRDPLTS
ncbi:Acyl-CoA dehydrogenase [Thermomonospora echinospora]|uniref:Acyl-CoA dehydrogenase n=1 Tax=Thermomonospora echinospora TaxID=1992 RepID=A0A1H6DTK4_9ACTN|nr:acyl-CoA dehydrogenase [Thermomonospora echinospora]SEG88677.1 Acyl-CoA dehydrogenase [Thermomonospora echinospora]